ncbi:MAG: hypothetical protein WEB04_12375 [Dehalococcoidia bacterium]
MGKFLEEEKRRLIAFRATSPDLSPEARFEGVFKGKPRPFCIPIGCSSQNLFSGIRQEAIEYFKEARIPWHQGFAGGPSNHLCDSQVACVNFLLPFSNNQEALGALLRPHYPQARRFLSMESSDHLVSFEWIGAENYLHERVAGQARTRGANATSADAAVMFEREDGKKEIVLIEWKYTESYGGASLLFAPSGTDRSKTYRPLLGRRDCPIDMARVPDADVSALFYEPFYQFMRQQLLAHEMERAKELGADIVRVLHIAPAQNTDFRRITSPSLRHLGATAVEVWKRLVRPDDRFQSVSTESLFGNSRLEDFPALARWREYINERYSWLSQDSPPLANA